MRRRDFVAGAFGMGASNAIAPRAWAQGVCYDGNIANCPDGYQLPTYTQMLEHLYGQLGPRLLEIRRAEYKTALNVIDASPKNANPVSVADFFMRVDKGEVDERWTYYAREWNYWANPIIMEFFNAVDNREPSKGDERAWCAAFVNWCLMRARTDRSDASALTSRTRSPAAVSFKKFGIATQTPRYGDLVVLERKDSNWRGHVGFFVSQTDDTVMVLGGNQAGARVRQTTVATIPAGARDVDVNKVGGRVGVDAYPKDGRRYRLHSYRTDPSLHDR